VRTNRQGHAESVELQFSLFSRLRHLHFAGGYYPDDGMGVRIEDSLVANADGTFEILADYPKDLILPVK